MTKDNNGPESASEKDDLLRIYSDRWPAFAGNYEFDLVLETLGTRVTRKARAEYTFTPEWEYFDLRKQAPFVGWPGSMIRMFVQSVPDRDDRDVPSWVRMRDIIENGILPEEFWDALDDALDQRCKAEDAERRIQAAGRKMPTGRKKRKAQ